MKPRKRGECNHQRPCPYFTCKHHALYFVTPMKLHALSDDEIIEMFTKIPVWASCTLDIIDHYSIHQTETHGPNHMTLQNIADINPAGDMSRERVRQLLDSTKMLSSGTEYRYGAIEKMRKAPRANILRPFTRAGDGDIMFGNMIRQEEA